jgi:Glucose / Sorbosone dehydrogenase/IPT/TIG domain
VRKLYVQYTAGDGSTKVVEYSTNGTRASSPRLLFSSRDPYGNHNGGMLAFGRNGRLHFTMGDGGSGGDPENRSQNPSSLFGKLLSINVATKGLRIEAFGLRNAWRFSFDRATGDLYLGDVGQGQIEEIDLQPVASAGGENYGWKMMEGTRCTGNDGNCPGGTPACDSPELTLPILEYDHGGGRCSVTGGYRYRGLRIPALYGRYVYGDYCSGEIWGAFLDGDTWATELLPIETGGLQTFGQDLAGELYVGNSDGVLYRIDPVAPATPVIDSVTPHQGYERGFDEVIITGSGFAADAQVLFGITPALSVTVVSPTELRVLSPPHSRGVVNVSVENPGAPADVEVAGFVYIGMDRVTPRSGDTRVITRTSE